MNVNNTEEKKKNRESGHIQRCFDFLCGIWAFSFADEGQRISAFYKFIFIDLQFSYAGFYFFIRIFLLWILGKEGNGIQISFFFAYIVFSNENNSSYKRYVIL